MKIRPKILKFQEGGLTNWINNNNDYFNWFSGLYPDALTLGGDPLKLGNSYWNKNLLSSSHYTTDDLRRSAYNNYLYTNDYNARLEDLNKWALSQNLVSLTNEQIRDLYNELAQKIRNVREAPQTYNKTGYSETNRIFRNMFYNRSKQGTNTPLYNIGYLENLDDIEGTSTWQRRMDRYQTSFDKDTLEGQKNRTFYIIKPDGTKVKVYKKENGDIELFPNQIPDLNINDTSLQLNVPDKIELSPKLLEAIEGTSGKVRVDDYPDDNKKNWWGEFSSKLLGLGPNILEDVRLGLSLNANKRIYDATLKGIRPNLMLTYNTYRQVVGDEATKLAYYRRAAAGQTKAALPFTSDADRLMAYQMEAKRIGDELRALGDLADNAEIRRTSDESNLHLWANTQRATEVANLNVAQINAANQAKWNLLALKYAADHSSWDNFLKGREYRWRQRLAEDLAYQRQLAALQNQYNLIDDSRILAAEQAVNNALEKTKVNGQYNHNHPEVLKAKRAYLKLLYELALEELKNQRLIRNPLFIKSGTKITYKKKDDLLYKSARDVVDHFRKMTKLTDDSYLKSRKNVPKLVPHPTRKMQQGGVAPFTVFTPVAMGGEMGYQTTTNTSSARGLSSSSSSENNKGKDTLDLIKKLFEAVHASGIPIDVLNIYNDVSNLLGRAEAFGKELSTLEIATIYLRSMNQLNRVKYEANAFDDAKKLAINKDALQEIAVDVYGRVAIQNKEGLVEYVDPNKAKDKGIILTNDLLLNLRALSPQLAFDNLSLQTVNNGVGMTKIAEWIKGNIAALGSNENSIEGYTKKLSSDIKKGLEILLDAPDGIYSITTTTEDLKQLAAAALNYLLVSMPDNMKQVLNARAIISGISPEEMITGLLTDTISSRISLKSNKKIDAITGKAAKDSDGNSKESLDGLKLDAASAFITGKGYNTNMELNTGSSYAVNVKARYSEFLKHSGENMGAGITMLEASTSTLKGVLDWNKATLGGSTLNPTAYNYIVLNNGEVAGVDLPTKPGDKNTPDFDMLKKLELLDDQLLIKGIEDTPQNWLKINEICSQLLLPLKYDNQGKLNKLSWNRFAAFLVTTTEKALNDKKVILDMLGTADEQTRKFYENIIQSKLNDKKYSLDSGWPIFGGKEELYQGTVFVPVKNNLVAGAISSGLKISMTDATDLELRQRGYDLLKISTYKKNELVL